MLNELKIGRDNPDGADQGFIGSYFPNLLDQKMFHPPLNNTKLDGTYRLPLGYQMDASYYCERNIFHISSYSKIYSRLENSSVIRINLVAIICSWVGFVFIVIIISDLRLRWNVPCRPNSVITFPGAPWLKPWYWWAWPVLPLGIQWHESRRQTLG